jgi:lysozyme
MKGIDVSKWQGNIDWSQIKDNTDLDFVMLRASIGLGTVDTNLAAYYAGATESGKKIGYYHFGTPVASSVMSPSARAIEEATFFLQTIKDFAPADMPLALDIEQNPVNLTRDEMLIYISTFLNFLGSAGYQCGVSRALYSYGPFLDSYLPPDHGLGSELLWLADYRATPHIPVGWTNYWMWQNSNKGVEHGITGLVDTDQTLS